MDCKLHRALEADNPDYAEQVGFLTDTWRDFTCGLGDVLYAVLLVGSLFIGLLILRSIYYSFKKDPKKSTATLIGMLFFPYILVVAPLVTIGVFLLIKDLALPSIAAPLCFAFGCYFAYITWKKVMIPLQEWLDPDEGIIKSKDPTPEQIEEIEKKIQMRMNEVLEKRFPKTLPKKNSKKK